MPHPSEHEAASRRLGADEAYDLAETLKALASSGRLLLSGAKPVEQLSAAVGLSMSATSHHLRLLRSLRLVRTRRDGRQVFYSLHDEHLADLLAAVRHHHEHVHPPKPLDVPEAPDRETA
jgi:DNA-binding transcriptional ArsR family regulator